jgi:hypothetical protein
MVAIRAPILGARPGGGGRAGRLVLRRRSEARRCVENDVDWSGPGGSMLAPKMGARDWGEGGWICPSVAIFASAAREGHITSTAHDILTGEWSVWIRNDDGQFCVGQGGGCGVLPRASLPAADAVRVGAVGGLRAVLNASRPQPTSNQTRSATIPRLLSGRPRTQIGCAGLGRGGAPIWGFREAGSASRIENSECGIDSECSRPIPAPRLAAREERRGKRDEAGLGNDASVAAALRRETLHWE